LPFTDAIKRLGEGHKKKRCGMSDNSTSNDGRAPAGSASSLAKASINTRGENCAEETRKRILDAAQSLFAAHGFSATTTKAIAQRANVPVGLIFYYFPSKQALLESIVNERSILTQLQAATDGLLASDLRTTLITLGSCYLTVLQQHEEIASILLREFRSNIEVTTQFRNLHKQHIELIASHLQRTLPGQQAVSAHTIETMARMFFYHIFMICVVEDEPDPLRFIEETVDILLHSLA
jgi:AcrR family transcriptional regulator